MRTRNQKKCQYNSVPNGNDLVPSLYHYNEMCLPILPYPRLSWASHQKPVNDYFCHSEIDKPGYDRIFSNHPLLKTHSNKENDNENHHPPFTESSEQLVERIIYSIVLWRLSNWECVLHVYLFMAEIFEEILDLHPLWIFFLLNNISNVWSSLYHPFRVILLLYCPWLVPVSEIYSHYRCHYLMFDQLCLVDVTNHT